MTRNCGTFCPNSKLKLLFDFADGCICHDNNPFILAHIFFRSSEHICHPQQQFNYVPMSWYLNENARKRKTVAQPSVVQQFHERCPPGFAPTRLVLLPASISLDLGVGHVYVKEESNHIGLPSFKILGAAWAIFRLLCDRYGLDVTASTFDLLLSLLQEESQTSGNKLELIAATGGNHGRAVTRMAYLFGLYVPRRVSQVKSGTRAPLL